ncbi:glycoside hydrolase family 3 N-terminal domain-containing protein [Umezawaea beigongshangensis]|uniref:beta-xylosidase/alpha-l-arabinosidase n=1 Tax=Umezawaea beigongshangensis TaxID=2780383 RepID=UPI0018F14864|nr:glycoside hydrolase family 3 N-terminal domain-containing protein [Umezawaea beigongshangensis]
MTDDRGEDIWRDPAVPLDARVADLVRRMTLPEKLAQLSSVWVSASSSGDVVAPHQDDLAEDTPPWAKATEHGLGQLCRTFGTAPVEPLAGARSLERTQREIAGRSRFGIPALAHEECLAGFTAWGATAYPVPLAWGASFDPDLVRRVAATIGRDMRFLGVHQGLAPVLDVVRDHRWGRVEETIGEDPFLVGSIGAAYVQGLEGAGVVSTLKHFAGYAGSRAGRNHAPVGAGPREIADVVLPPFEMALRLGGARSVMHAYTEIDGVPSAADGKLLTTLLRDEWGFTGTLVADYFGISFLHVLHGVAADARDAAAQALTAGVDVELPAVRCYGDPLLEQVTSGAVSEDLVDRALTRVLRQKGELGLLDGVPTAPDVDAPIDLDPPENRELARELANESVVLLANSGVLPLERPGRVAVVGPLADDPHGMLGCYSFPNHVGVSHPEVGLGIDIPTVLDAVRDGLSDDVVHAPGCEVTGDDRSGFAEAVRAASEAEVCLVVVGDRSGLFGRGTSGEGCDAPDLRLPGAQADLVHAVLDSGTPVVLVVCSGRPYALGEFGDRPAAVVQLFFPGEEGGPALVEVLAGRVNPSGRLPVSVPALPGAQPGTYLTSFLGTRNDVTSLDPTPLHPFGHGLSYTEFAYRDLRLSEAEVAVDGEVLIGCTVSNTGDRSGTEVVQLYLRDPVAQVTRPVRQLAGFARVDLEPGASRTVWFRLHADRTSFTGRAGRRIVEPGDIEVHVGRSSTDTPLSGSFRLTGQVREVGHDRVLDTPVTTETPVDEGGLRAS